MAMNKLLEYCVDAFEMRDAWPKGAGQFKNKKVRLLASICWWLQVKHANGPFVFGNRDAAKILDVSPVSAWKYFNTLIKAGWIEVVASGHRRWGVPNRFKKPGELKILERCRMASEYRCPSAICVPGTDWDSNFVVSNTNITEGF